MAPYSKYTQRKWYVAIRLNGKSFTCSPAGHCESIGKQVIQQNCVPSSHIVSRAFLQSKAEADGDAGDELDEGQRFERDDE